MTYYVSCRTLNSIHLLLTCLLTYVVVCGSGVWSASVISVASTAVDICCRTLPAWMSCCSSGCRVRQLGRLSRLRPSASRRRKKYSLSFCVVETGVIAVLSKQTWHNICTPFLLTVVEVFWRWTFPAVFFVEILAIIVVQSVRFSS